MAFLQKVIQLRGQLAQETQMRIDDLNAQIERLGAELCQLPRTQRNMLPMLRIQQQINDMQRERKMLQDGSADRVFATAVNPLMQHYMQTRPQFQALFQNAIAINATETTNNDVDDDDDETVMDDNIDTRQQQPQKQQQQRQKRQVEYGEDGDADDDDDDDADDDDDETAATDGNQNKSDKINRALMRRSDEDEGLAAAAAAASASTDGSTATAAAAGTIVKTETVTVDDIYYLRRLQRLLSPSGVVPMFIQSDQCPQCRIDMVKINGESQLKCPRCRQCIEFLNSTSEALPFGEDVDIASHIYINVKHFRSWLLQFRQDTPDVPDAVISAVHHYFHRRYHDASKRKYRPTPVRHALKRMELTQWCGSAQVIVNRLTNTPIAKFAMSQYDRIVWRFEATQVTWASMKPEERCNFMNYRYFVRNACQMDGLDHFAMCFMMPKGRKVVRALRQMLQTVCDEMQRRRRYPSDPQWIMPPSE